MLQRARPWLGTIVEVRVAAADGAREAAAMAAAFDAVARVHAALSFHSADSELSRLNREAARGEVAVGADTAAVLALALELAAASAGAFDPCVGGALVAAGVLPAPAGAPRPDAAADWRDVVLRGDRVRLRRPLWLDLGGIAKGHAVDVALAAALAAGGRAAQVNAGGDLAVAGDTAALVQMRVPARGARLLPLAELRDGAAAGSAHGFDAGVPVHHDPRRGAPPAAARAVTVFAPRCALADALTKPVLCDPAAAAPLLQRYGASACVLGPDARLQRWGLAA